MFQPIVDGIISMVEWKFSLVHVDKMIEFSQIRTNIYYKLVLWSASYKNLDCSYAKSDDVKVDYSEHCPTWAYVTARKIGISWPYHWYNSKLEATAYCSWVGMAPRPIESIHLVILEFWQLSSPFSVKSLRIRTEVVRHLCKGQSRSTRDTTVEAGICARISLSPLQCTCNPRYECVK